MPNGIEQAAQAIANAERVVAVTGAGVSEESGIPTFRGDHGIWQKYPIEEFGTIDAYLSDANKVWTFWCELSELVKDCKPNPAHYALAELESLGRMETVITQNVDNLHQEAGSNSVLEYHGNARKLVCLECRQRSLFDLDKLTTLAPKCEACGGLLKPAVIMFGEMIPGHALFEASARAQKCDVMIVVGTSAQVFPAAELPFTAKERGAFIIECNTEPTDFTRLITDAFLEGPAGDTLPELVQIVKGCFED
jgi:NAD-dependent deacetylase